MNKPLQWVPSSSGWFLLIPISPLLEDIASPILSTNICASGFGYCPYKDYKLLDGKTEQYSDLCWSVNKVLKHSITSHSAWGEEVCIQWGCLKGNESWLDPERWIGIREREGYEWLVSQRKNNSLSSRGGVEEDIFSQLSLPKPQIERAPYHSTWCGLVAYTYFWQILISYYTFVSPRKGRSWIRCPSLESRHTPLKSRTMLS